MTFEEYKAEDFLQDESFLKYCLAKDDEAVKFWTSWLRSNPHKEVEVKEAVELYHVLNGGNSALQYLEDERYFVAALENFKSGEALNPRTLKVKTRWWYTAAAALAAGIIATAAILFFQADKSSPAYVESSRAGERRSFQLPDGSNILLNSGSTLTIARGFNNKARELTLEGEAYFEVAHMPDKPFVIHTAEMEVKVLGTTFNVKAYPTDLQSQTSLIEGSVEVTLKHDQNRKVTLSPNQKIVYKKDAERVPANILSDRYTVLPLESDRNAAMAPEVSWTRNRLVFENESFAEIANVLERWFDVDITIESGELENYRFTGTFEKKTIREVLDALKLSGGFEYELEGKKVVVTQKGD